MPTPRFSVGDEVFAVRDNRPTKITIQSVIIGSDTVCYSDAVPGSFHSPVAEPDCYRSREELIEAFTKSI